MSQQTNDRPEQQAKEEETQIKKMEVEEGNEKEVQLTDENENEGGEKEGTNIDQLMEEMQIEGEQEEELKEEGERAEQEDENFKSPQNQSQALNQTKYFVDINKTSISFGRSVLFPGSIEEVQVSIGLKEQILQNRNGNPYMLRVIAKCSNEEFDVLDEYVFSVRSNQRFEYFEQVRFKIRKKQKALVKVAVKIPPVKQSYSINGVLEIQLQSLEPVCLPILSKCQVPQIVCLKDLYKVDEGCNMIKVPGKKNQMRMPPIPFKNLSNCSFTLEVQAITNENCSKRPYDIITQNFVNCQANSQFFVNLQLKENLNYKGVLPYKDTIRKILILKIKNSSIFFNFPLQVQVFESTNSGGMS